MTQLDHPTTLPRREYQARLNFKASKELSEHALKPLFSPEAQKRRSQREGPAVGLWVPGIFSSSISRESLHSELGKRVKENWRYETQRIAAHSLNIAVKRNIIKSPKGSSELPPDFIFSLGLSSTDEASLQALQHGFQQHPVILPGRTLSITVPYADLHDVMKEKGALQAHRDTFNAGVRQLGRTAAASHYFVQPKPILHDL